MVQETQYSQLIVVNELLKVLYNPVLKIDEKLELISAAQELF